MKYLLDPTVFALDENISERDFKVYITRLLLWDKWLKMYPEDIYVLSNTEEILYSLNYFPIYPVFDSLMKKHNINYTQADLLNQAIQRLLQKAKTIDKVKGRKVDDDVIFVDIKIDKEADWQSHPVPLRNALKKMMWCLYCRCLYSEENIDTFVVFGKNQEGYVNMEVVYKTIVQEKDELKEIVNKDKVKVLYRPSLASYFKNKSTPVDILTKSDSVEDLNLAIRVSVYQNGQLPKIMEAFDNYDFKIQDSFHKDYTTNHYLSQPTFLSSFKDSMSHSLLNMNLNDLEDFRTGKGGNNPQKKHPTNSGVWEAWRWKVTESVSFQYWRIKDKYKFANIGEHDYYVCKWEN